MVCCLIILHQLHLLFDIEWRSWPRHYATSRKVAGSIPDEVTEFFDLSDLSKPQYGPGVDSVSNRNEYQESSLEVKACR
jgi:hypothetical protein